MHFLKMLDWKEKTNSLVFWRQVHEFGDSTGNYPFRILSDGVRKMRCVPVFNDEIDRTMAAAKRTRELMGYLEPEVREDIIICKLALNNLGRETTNFQPPAALITC